MVFVIFSSFCVKPSLSEWLSLLDEPVQNATRTHTHTKKGGGVGICKVSTPWPKALNKHNTHKNPIQMENVIHNNKKEKV